MAYRVRFTHSANAQLQALTAGQRKVILEAVERQLTHAPLVETRNRKALQPNPIAPWELRVGQLRVLYDVTPASQEEPSESEEREQGDDGEVQILAIGVKRGNVLLIAGRKVDL
jgi:mRNA-degrading endonuclease RelE of RelBE toxin-antitoxin system